jgi:ribose/xylose/arabinose/galactoside ABC-type transport system permease subunit
VALTTASSVSPVAGVLAGLAVGLAVGIANGLIVTIFRINPLIGTLAMTFVVSGIAAIVTEGNLVVALDHLDFQSFAATKIVGISSAAWMMIIIAILAMILLSRTTFGRYVYATGGNTQAARLGGVRISAIRVATFALSGTAAALAGTLDASRVLSAQASSGQFLTFTVLTGIIVGGTSILGGEGTIGRTVLGCLFVALIANGFNLLGLDPFYQQVTLGVILLRGRRRRLVRRLSRPSDPPPSLASIQMHSVVRSTGRSSTVLPHLGHRIGLACLRIVGPDQGASTDLAVVGLTGGWFTFWPFVRGGAVRPWWRAPARPGGPSIGSDRRLRVIPTGSGSARQHRRRAGSTVTKQPAAARPGALRRDTPSNRRRTCPDGRRRRPPASDPTLRLVGHTMAPPPGRGRPGQDPACGRPAGGGHGALAYSGISVR